MNQASELLSQVNALLADREEQLEKVRLWLQSAVLCLPGTTGLKDPLACTGQCLSWLVSLVHPHTHC